MSGFLYFTDLHAGLSRREAKGRHSKLSWAKRVICECFKQADERDIGTIVFGGDLYDVSYAPPIEVVNEITASFADELAQYSDINVYAISGNHDFASTNRFEQGCTSSGESALKHLFFSFDNFHFMDWDQSFNCGDNLIVGVPWFRIPADFEKYLDTLLVSDTFQKHKGKKVLVIHQTPKGVLPDCAPYDVDPADDRFSWFDLVLCGHVHERKHLSDKFILGGSVMQHNFGEGGQDKGFWIVDSDAKASFVPIDFTPKYYTLDKDSNGGASDVRDCDYVRDLRKSRPVSISENPLAGCSVKSREDIVRDYVSLSVADKSDRAALCEVGLSILNSVE